VSAAYDQQGRRYFLDFESAGRVHQPRALEIHALESYRAGAGSENGVLELDAGGSAVAERLHAQVARVFKRGPSVEDLHAGALAHGDDALGELVVYPALPRAQLIDVYFRFAEVDAEYRCVLALLHYFSGMQQSF